MADIIRFFQLFAFLTVVFTAYQIQATVADCRHLPPQALTTIQNQLLLKSVQLNCDTSGHRLSPIAGQQWIDALNRPFSIAARHLMHDTTQMQQDFFTAVSAKRLDSHERALLNINLLQHVFADFYMPKKIIQVRATTIRGVELTLYLMPERGIVCQQNCSTLQVFSIKGAAPAAEMTSTKTAWLIALGLFNWPILVLYLVFMLLPSLYPDQITYGSKKLDWLISLDRRGLMMIPLSLALQWKVLTGDYTKQAKQTGHLTMLRIGQGMVLTNIALIICFIAE
ncbi:hypothetical protein [Rheinheimera sp.]|uniref:hypothetical protein n=1 Tax=Rheinheimera sp. TaxID=1869214 RepID=UPI002736FB6C|nr:hypothetical protein [Rheinheimera sp.]MDP2714344.1 hypothetical protein [Rheinheimera sp.]